MIVCPKVTLSGIFLSFRSTANVDYEAGTYIANFFPGQMYAIVMVPTLEDNTTELSEYFRVELYSSDRPEFVAFGSPNMTFITIEDNDPGSKSCCVCAVTFVTAHFLKNVMGS